MADEGNVELERLRMRVLARLSKILWHLEEADYERAKTCMKYLMDDIPSLHEDWSTESK